MMTIKIIVLITAPCWHCADLPLVAGSGQAPMHLIRGAHQGEVGQRLGKVPHVFAAWPQLLSVEAGFKGFQRNSSYPRMSLRIPADRVIVPETRSC
jgi:hypothetical protein